MKITVIRMGNSRQPGYPDKESGGRNKSKNCPESGRNSVFGKRRFNNRKTDRRDERCDFVELGIIETTSTLTDIQRLISQADFYQC